MNVSQKNSLEFFCFSGEKLKGANIICGLELQKWKLKKWHKWLHLKMLNKRIAYLHYFLYLTFNKHGTHLHH